MTIYYKMHVLFFKKGVDNFEIEQDQPNSISFILAPLWFSTLPFWMISTILGLLEHKTC